MPTTNCDPNSRGSTFDATTIQASAPNGSGAILAEIRYSWDGVSVWPNCDGPVSMVHTQNTSSQPAWAWLNSRKQAGTWVKIDPGTNITITAAGQLRNLGLEKRSDISDVAVVFVQPA